MTPPNLRELARTLAEHVVKRPHWPPSPTDQVTDIAAAMLNLIEIVAPEKLRSRQLEHENHVPIYSNTWTVTWGRTFLFFQAPKVFVWCPLCNQQQDWGRVAQVMRIEGGKRVLEPVELECFQRHVYHRLTVEEQIAYGMRVASGEMP